MLFDPYCSINFIENNTDEVVEYKDNWTDGKHPIYHLFGGLLIDMGECIHIDVAKMYLQKLQIQQLMAHLSKLECPCKY